VDLGLTGKTAIVTGGSKGLGQAIALELAREGVDVAICSRSDAEIKGSAEAIATETGRKVVAEVCDVTDSEQITGFVGHAAAELGGLDILVNNAGRATPGTFASVTDEQMAGDFDVKVFSIIRCTREAVPHMRARGGGRVININAVYGKCPDPGFFATSVNRAAGQSLTKVLAMELAADGILVNGVNIGFVVTPQWKNIHAKRAPELSEEEFFRQWAEREVPLGRFGRPDEVAGMVAFLASERAGYITGASIDVAGGMGRYV
jgi:NAD(P)-dependent dehydrogenase (short-subunit alcohol dehydrogenase family)